ncbi:25S rRNA (uridine(2634)-N(3))-methyltransferase [Yarrowia sp. B02]|nr:25S rRNA (uridine(2634)-N(3))-methyltransferase [Yarrowia sp. B02]
MAKKGGLKATLARSQQIDKATKQEAEKAKRRKEFEEGKRKSQTQGASKSQKQANKRQKLEHQKLYEKPDESAPLTEEQIRIRRERTIPWDKDDKILLLGEGDFSFALCCKKEKLAANIVATAFDSEEEVKRKYENGSEILKELQTEEKTDDKKDEEEEEDFGEEESDDELKEAVETSSHFDIDATKLANYKMFKNMPNGNKFDAIVFNFPHTGDGIKDQDRNVLRNQQMLHAFFKCAIPLLKNGVEVYDKYQKYKAKHDGNPPKPGTTHYKAAAKPAKAGKNAMAGYSVHGRAPLRTGKVIVTLFDGAPYNLWAIKSLAKDAGFKSVYTGPFDWEVFPNYHHRRTRGMGDTTKKAETRKAKFFVFEVEDGRGIVTKKTENDDASDSE